MDFPLHGAMPDIMLKTFDLLTTPAFVIDERLTILSLNTTACGLFLSTPGEIEGKNLSTLLFRPPDHGSNRNAKQDGGMEHLFPPCPSGEAGGETSCEVFCRKKNGDIFSASLSLLPYTHPDRKLVVVQDISGRKRLQQRASQRTKELSIFNTFAKILTRNRDIDRIMYETIDMLISLMGADKGWIYHVDEDAGVLRLAAQRNFSPAMLERVRIAKPGQSLCGKVLTSRRPLLVKRSSEDPRVPVTEEGMESMAGVPIMSSQGDILGVLAVSNRNPSYFTSMDMQLLAVIGNQFGVALENARLIAQLRDKMRQIELINELSGIINSSLSIGTVFRIMVSEIRKLISYDRASLLLFNERDNNLIIFALDTDMKTILTKGVRAPLSGTGAGWAIRNNRPWINRDLLEEIVFPLDRKLLNEGIRSTISIPLYRDKMLGVFNLDSTEPHHYTARSMEILRPVAKHISIALENAALFEEASKEKKEWEKTFDAIADMVWIEDEKQCVMRANKILLLKTGFSVVEIMESSCGEILAKLGVSGGESLCSDAVTAKRPSFMELRGAGGNIFYFWTYPLTDEEGELYAVVHYLKDVTPQKKLEQQLVRADKMASLGTLVAGIAHEINNPLGIIAGYSEALLDRAKSRSLLEQEEFEDFPEYLQTIHNEIFRCKGILRTLLDFARPSGGICREIDINELIKEVILLVNHRAKRLKHNIELQLDRDVPKIYAEPGTLRQLFMNILINSMYFTPERGSITIKTEAAQDPPGKGKEDADWIRVSIKDTGAGIPADIIGKIFDPFFTTKPVGEGTGLGLSICHKIVEEHGGSIDVSSEEGKGTTFFIRLPARGGEQRRK
ncbi:MAG: GAF domain-containing protein [Thermodesulfovibrionales bacterium]